MKTLLRNARILVDTRKGTVIDGSILIDGDTIVEVGEVEDGECEKIIDCEGNLLIPGFKNAHTHSPMTFSRSIADDLPLQDWLHEKIFPMEAKLLPEEQYHLAKVAILEYLTSGITACFDMYYNPLEMARASQEMGFRTVLLGTVNDYRESVGEMKEMFLRINGKSPLVTYRLGFHAEYTTSEPILEELSKAAHELKTSVWAHNSETWAEVEECKKRHNGLSPTEYMDSLGLFDYGGGGFHCVAFSDSDIEIFRKHGCYVVSCPGSNAKLASGFAPLEKFVESGITLALGTDGPGSNNALDMFYEMRLASVLQKLDTRKADAFDALLSLDAATYGGAKALGLDDCLSLSPAMKADIVMIDLKRPSMQPLNSLAKNLVYSGSKDIVKMTMINGKVLYMDGKFFVNEDIGEIYRKAQEITDRLKG